MLANIDLQELLNLNEIHHRERCYWMEQRKRSDLSLGAHLRTTMGWSKTLPAGERKKISARAKEVIETAERLLKAEDAAHKRHEKALLNAAEKKKPIPQFTPRKEVKGEHSADFQRYRHIAVPTVRARFHYDALEKDATEQCAQLMQQLGPIAQWWSANVFATSLGSLAMILGEAGDLGKYSTHSKLWKRMGLAFMTEDGVRQGGLRKGAKKEDWIRHGYNARRRSRMWVVGASLIKQGGRYKTIYERRKQYETQKCEEKGILIVPSARRPKKGDNAQYMTEGYRHNRSQRYMEKKLLRDLWNAWRRAMMESPTTANKTKADATQRVAT